MLKKFMLIVIISLFVSTGSILAAQFNRPLEDQVLRLHVIANSDAPGDQALKLAVKDEIVTMMQQEFTNVQNAEVARQLAAEDLPAIKATAEECIKAKGFNYPVDVVVGEELFPTKSYGNLVFPAGNYQAVRVIIGEGKGKNWWCVLFPPLCLVSSSDQGLCLSSPQQVQVTFKCLELIPHGVRLVTP